MYEQCTVRCTSGGTCERSSSSWIYGGIDARGSTNWGAWAEEIAAEVSAVDMVGWVLRERSFSSQLGIELCQPTHCDGWQSLTRLMVG